MSSPWLDFLAQAGARFSDNTAGIHTFSTPREDVQRSAAGTVAVPLSHLGHIRVTGEDATTLLHNLLSSDIKKLPPRHAQRSSFNTPKGRMLASFLVWREGEDYLLQVCAALAAALTRKLSMYVLRAHAKLTDASEELVAIGLAGPDLVHLLDQVSLTLPPETLSVAEGAVQVVRTGEHRAIVLTSPEAAPELWRKLIAAGAIPAGTAAWQWLDIQAGIPLITAALQEEFVLQMVNFELIDGVSFHKGCYPGQEIVARMQYKGTLKKRTYRAHVEGEAPEAGTDVFSSDFGDQSAGKVLSATPAPEGGSDLLVCVQIASHDADNVRLASPDGARLRFEPLPYPV